MKDFNRMLLHMLRIILPLVLTGVLILQGCSSSYQGAKKGRHGMVPCPCEKNNKRR